MGIAFAAGPAVNAMVHRDCFPPYFIFGLPRCRTAWFATLLSFGKRVCFHEKEAESYCLGSYCNDIANHGNASTLAWKLLRKIHPWFPRAKHRFVWLDRSPSSVANSCADAGHPEFSAEVARAMRAEAEDIGALSQLVINVENVTLDVARTVWEHLIPDEDFPEDKAANLVRMNVRLSDTEFEHVTSHKIPWLMEAIA